MNNMPIAPKQCRKIDYNSVAFASEVMDGLEQDGIFAVVGLPEELRQVMKTLFVTGDDFFDHLHEYKEDEYPTKRETNNLRGLYSPKKSSLACNNAARFFISVDKGEISNEKMPLYKGEPAMSEAAISFHKYSDSLIARILQAIADTLDLNSEDLQDPILGSSAVCLTRYFPITQDRAAQMFRAKALSVSGDGIMQFGLHADFCPVTILGYRADPQGLMIQDRQTKMPVPLEIDCNNEPYLLVFTGRILKELTNGRIRALKHQVLTSPAEQHLEAQKPTNQWRFTLSDFTYFRRDIVPLNTRTGVPVEQLKNRKHERTYPITQAQFEYDHLKRAEEHNTKELVKELPADVMKKYPVEVLQKDIFEAQLAESSGLACKK